jgi:hypothetical protein
VATSLPNGRRRYPSGVFAEDRRPACYLRLAAGRGGDSRGLRPSPPQAVEDGGRRRVTCHQGGLYSTQRGAASVAARRASPQRLGAVRLHGAAAAFKVRKSSLSRPGFRKEGGRTLSSSRRRPGPCQPAQPGAGLRFGGPAQCPHPRTTSSSSPTSGYGRSPSSDARSRAPHPSSGASPETTWRC